MSNGARICSFMCAHVYDGCLCQCMKIVFFIVQGDYVPSYYISRKV